jgi:hypothetical protein
MKINHLLTKSFHLVFGLLITVLCFISCTKKSERISSDKYEIVYDSIKLERLRVLTTEYAKIVGQLPLKVIFLNSSRSEFRVIIASTIDPEEIKNFTYDELYINNQDTFLISNNMSTLFYKKNPALNDYLDMKVENLNVENIYNYKSSKKYGYGTWAILISHSLDSLDKLYPDPFGPPIIGSDYYFQFPL